MYSLCGRQHWIHSGTFLQSCFLPETLWSLNMRKYLYKLLLQRQTREIIWIFVTLLHREGDKSLHITFHLKDLFLKVFQYSRESVIVLYFEGIFVFWFWSKGLNFIQFYIFDLKPEFCLKLWNTSKSNVSKINNTVNITGLKTVINASDTV